ncbi:tetratricopeptide repeat protein [Yoonia sp.]|uniref:tetratricopeptide repeat protein n=1 Tax=Yoonia sp. TaxID=2212373 RepID=UPI001A03EE40|nr:tetratricopeptide repeat protein [Yoonia sp.]MBE0412958.1 tetratricopeptide repeat protein [Yoonia sp.]
MRHILPLCFPVFIAAAPAFAQDCPPAPDHSARQDAIIAQLGQAKSEGDAFAISQELWALWFDAPDARAQAFLDEGISRRSGHDFLGSRDTLDALVDYCPDYAEGYNQRAFTNFLRQDFAAALHDLDQALAINPKHIAALSGKALTLMGLGRLDEAQDTLGAAVKLNPWLRERALLVDVPGTDI